ncbi:MAG: 2Fe-2S iron-sulfur cluster-binding protein [Candidatus Methylomirabilia bacterium]
MSDSRLPPHPAQRVNRGKPIVFTFEGRPIQAYEGESVAAALYASGVRIFSRSFKYHRPRGLLCVAGRCANCFMDVNGIPNVRTCVEPARHGMRARGQHAWPSLDRDLFAGFDRLDRVLPVGFYHKTFIHPTWLWPSYEKVLRHLAGLGRLDLTREPEGHGEHLHRIADLAVVGGGPAGIAAALEAARLGVEVLLIDDEPTLGGHLQWQLLPSEDGLPGYELARALADRIRAEPRVDHLAGATAFGLYDGRLLAVVQGERLIKIRAQRIVVATGGFERPLVFQHNDRPGVFLGEGLQRLITLYGVKPGQRAVVIANSDRGLKLTRELSAAGLEVAAVADARPEPQDSAEARRLREARIPILPGHTVLEARGKKRLDSAVLASLDQSARPIAGSEQTVQCDLLALATGWEPSTALLAQGDARLVYRTDLGAFFPADFPAWLFAAGEVKGARGLSAIQRDGRVAGLKAAHSLGAGDRGSQALAEALEVEASQPLSIRPLVGVPHPKQKRFVCLCEDVTEKDLSDAIREGFDHIEILKRYTTVTMGPCQGKMCHFSSIGVCAAETGRSIPETGTTTARPPVKPVPLGVLAGPHHEPVKRTPLHHLHAALGATWMDMGLWKRPLVYTSVEAECRAVHERVGLIDVSTLGKLDIKGKDAAQFLDWIHPNRFSDLKVGRVRYRAMLDDAGIILDDGTVARLSEDHFFLTTGSGSLEVVEQWLEWWLAGSGHCVHVTDVTGGLAAINLAGPKSREVLARLTDLDLSAGALPYLAAAQGKVAGIPVLILRIGFVGELGYEMHFPAEYGAYLWEALSEAGRELDIAPFGVEAQRVLRLEKLHIIPSHDTDALSNPLEADMAWVVKLDKPDFIGRAALASVKARGLRQRLVGFEMLAPVVPGEGDAVVADGLPVGRVTSAKWSALLARAIGMAWVPSELAIDGGTINVKCDGQIQLGRVVTKPFYDPEGKRLRS